MLKVHVSLSYHKTPLDELDVFAVGVRDGIFSNDPPFTVPPILQPAFQLLINTYVDKRGAYLQGGLAQKGPFVESKNALMGGLDTYAGYVDVIANGNANIITLAGFVPTKEGSTEHHVPAQPAGATITRGGIGEMFAEVPKVDGAEYYGCIVFAGEPMPPQMTLNGAGQLVLTADNTPDPPGGAPKTGIVAVFDMSKSRKKHFLGLQTGTMYYFYFYAGNATGVSILSEVRNAVCG